MGDRGLKGDQGIQGTTGAQGATGVQGQKGDQGATGERGQRGYDGIGLTYKDFKIGSSYSRGNYVFAKSSKDSTHDSMYIAQKNITFTTKNPSNDLDSGNWIEFKAPQGATGAQGEQGLVGANGTKGDQGLPGPRGATGLQGSK